MLASSIQLSVLKALVEEQEINKIHKEKAKKFLPYLLKAEQKKYKVWLPFTWFANQKNIVMEAIKLAKANNFGKAFGMSGQNLKKQLE